MQSITHQVESLLLQAEQAAWFKSTAHSAIAS
jgi:hypothetical protein